MRAQLCFASLMLAACGVPLDEKDADAAGTQVRLRDAGASLADGGSADVERDAGVERLDAGFVDAGVPDSVSFKMYTMNLRTAVIERDTAELRTGMVAAVILDELPDVVCVQEAVQMPNLENRAASLAAMTGYEYEWARTFSVDGFFDEGIALLSRWPIEWIDVVDLPHADLGGQNERKAIGAGINTPHGELRAFCAHMTTDPIASFKVDQAERILELIDAHPGERPALFAGDLNATPDEEAMHTFVGAGLIDAWAAARPDDAGPTHPSDNPDRRIDYVWMAPPSRVIECHHVLDAPEEGVWASDHIGLICSITD